MADTAAMPTRPDAQAIEQRRRMLLELVERTRAALGPDAVAELEINPGSETTIEQGVEDLLYALRDRLADDAASRPAVEPLLRDLLALRDEIRTSVYVRQLATITDLRKALASLRAVRSVDEAIERCPRIACESCGFQAAVLVRVSGPNLIPASAWSERDPNWYPKVQRSLMDPNGGQLSLDGLTVEKEMLRRRKPFLVRDALNDGAPAQELRRLTGVQSYVAAPIMPEDRIIAFIYAIHFEVALDIVDRDLLWAFAEGYGYALERTILRSRVAAQAQIFSDLMKAAEGRFRSFSAAGMELVDDLGGEVAEEAPRAAAPFLSANSSAQALLSRRELEVMELLAEGATNRMIAERLVIAEATAKAHVAQILRKLTARNRAEAVNKYLQMLQAS